MFTNVIVQNSQVQLEVEVIKNERLESEIQSAYHVSLKILEEMTEKVSDCHVGVNGFGRIGRLFTRAALLRKTFKMMILYTAHLKCKWLPSAQIL